MNSATERLRVAIDARPALDPRRTGVGRYVDSLLRNLAAVDPGSDYLAWHLDPRGRHRGAFDSGPANLIEITGRIPNRWYGPVASRTGHPRVERWVGDHDAFLATNFLPPATSGKGVVMVVHDLAFDLMPETAPHVDARWRRTFSDWLERSAAVIVPSASARDDLIKLYETDPNKVEVIHHGASAARRPSAEAISKARLVHGVPDGPYFYFVGGVEPRKNLPSLIRAFGIAMDGAQAESASLVVSGGDVAWNPGARAAVDSAISALPPAVASKVIMTGWVDDADRDALLAGSCGFVFPSSYEGFGLPLLEAFAMGTPVLTSDISAMPEVAGDAAVYCDPADPDSIASGLTSLLADAASVEKLVQAGRRRLAEFTWERCAESTAQVLKRAANRSV